MNIKLQNKKEIIILCFCALIQINLSCKKQNKVIDSISRPLIDSINVYQTITMPANETFCRWYYKYYYANNKISKIIYKRKKSWNISGGIEPINYYYQKTFTFQYDDKEVKYCEYDSLNNLVYEHIYPLAENGLTSEYYHDQNGFISTSDLKNISNNLYFIGSYPQNQRNMEYTSFVATFNQYNGDTYNNPVFYFADFIGRSSYNLLKKSDSFFFSYEIDSLQRVKVMEHSWHWSEGRDKYTFYYLEK